MAPHHEDSSNSSGVDSMWWAGYALCMLLFVPMTVFEWSLLKGARDTWGLRIRGVDAQARVERLGDLSGPPGITSCYDVEYSYEVANAGRRAMFGGADCIFAFVPKPGESLPIRYLPERPEVSETLETLRPGSWWNSWEYLGLLLYQAAFVAMLFMALTGPALLVKRLLGFDSERLNDQ